MENFLMTNENETHRAPGLLKQRTSYKPFWYPWADQAALKQHQMHWLPEEVPMADDVKDWNKDLTTEEKHLLTQVFRFFTQADIDVGDCYMRKFMSLGWVREINCMLASFADFEANIHTRAYAHLLETVGFPDSEYEAFFRYKAMKDKHDFMEGISTSVSPLPGETPEQTEHRRKRAIARSLAAVSAFGEGLQLFASFVILLNFPRHGKMKGMGQIVTWSVRDETLHCLSMIKLFKQFVSENPEVMDDELRAEIRAIGTTMVEHENAFVDLAFELGPVKGLSADEIKRYIQYTADRRFIQLGMKPVYGVDQNPLPWVDALLNAPEHTNFFENQGTEYSKASTLGTWGGVWDEVDKRRSARDLAGAAVMQEAGLSQPVTLQ